MNISIISYNRPEYFIKTYDSILESIQDINHIYVFFDGPVDNAINRQINYVRDNTDDNIYNIITSDVNLGCGLRSITAREHIFNKLKLPECFFFEDDMVISKDYLRLCSNIKRWLYNNYDGKFVVQGWNENIYAESQQKILEDYIENTQCHWWGFLMDIETWGTIYPVVKQYKSLILGHDYHRIPHGKIYKSIIYPNLQEGYKTFHKNSNFPINQTELERIIINKGTGQDMMMSSSCLVNGIYKVAPVITRGTSIGERGIHMTPDYHRKLNLHLINKYEGLNCPEEFQVLS